MKYSSGLATKGQWYTDSNGKEMILREYNKRGPSYPKPYKISEPVAGNFYPVNALMSMDDGENELAVLTDVSQAGASLADGELEFLVHRRLQDDDHRGVQVMPSGSPYDYLLITSCLNSCLTSCLNSCLTSCLTS